jgi:CDP-glycerol glycerophosphotransferase (TagB/SpsB family)
MKRGILEESFPGPVVKDTDAIIDTLMKYQFDVNVVDQYAKKWNKYSNGRSSQNLVNYMFGETSPQLQQQRAL